jgi:Chaperone of endosialidase
VYSEGLNVTTSNWVQITMKEICMKTLKEFHVLARRLFVSLLLMGLLTLAYGQTNTATGYLALPSGTGFDNTADGAYALYSNSDGDENTAGGYEALDSNTSGIDNTAFGAGALSYSTTGWMNTTIGYYGGRTLDYSPVTGSENTLLGGLATLFTGSLNNATAIGARSQVSQSNTIVLGSIAGVNDCNAPCGNTSIGIGTTTPQATLHLDYLEEGNGASDSLLIGGFSTRGLIMFDGGPAVDIASINVPLFINNGGQATILNASGGGVGIGGGPIRGYSLSIARGTGAAISDYWSTYSSRRWKTNIHTLRGALDKVERLRGVSYDRKDSGKHEIGVIAEEVGAILPEVVSWEKNGKDATGVDYGRLTALLIEALKEQQTQIRKQQREIRAQQAQLRERAGKDALLESRLTQLEHDRRELTKLASVGPVH